MAEVWVATDERLQRPIAIKLLAAPLTAEPEHLVRFFNEAQLIARISHPNVVRVLDFGEHEGRPFLVMELIGNGSVEDLVGEPVPEQSASDLIRAAARGAGAAHAMGLVHRDIKPANIFLDEEGTPKLADFGIALAGGQEKLTATGTAIGSPHYVSPEQASGKEVVPASDVYSLGVVFYELLAGRRPFESETAMGLAIAHVEQEPAPPSRFVADLDPALETIVLRCLAKDPDERFPDGDQFANALERGASTLPPTTIASTAAIEDTSPTPVPIEATSGRGRRVAAVISLVALFLAAIAFGVIALGRGTGDDEVAAAPRHDAFVTHERRSPSPRTSATAEEVTSVGSPTPTPSPTHSAGTERGSTRVIRGNSHSSSSDPDNGGGGGDSGASPEPSSSPTSEPTSDPSPSSSP